MNKPLPSREALEREVRGIKAMQAFGTWQGRIWIAISFTHMLTTMLLFRPNVDGWVRVLSTLVLGATVLFLDIGIMFYAHVLYLNDQAEDAPRPPARVMLTYRLAVAAEWIFNFASLYSNRPPPEKLPSFLSTGLAVLFGSFVTLSILNAPLLVAMLDRTLFPKLDQLAARIQHDEAEKERKAAELRRQQEREADERRRKLEMEEERRRRRDARWDAGRQPALPSSTIGPERQLPPVDESAIYQPKTVNVDGNLSIEVDGKLVKVDDRAAQWLTMNRDERKSYQAISDALGGTPSKQYVGLHVKLYRRWLAEQSQEVPRDDA